MEQEVKKERKFKLNTKQTFKIAFAFFGILMLWQVYNTYCPIILEALLKSQFGADKDYNLIIGIIMALDNVAAIIIMPIFGKLSDKTSSKWGKRMPYIAIGMLLTIIVFPFIALCCMWNSLAGVIIAMMLFLIIMQSYRNPAVALMPDVTPKPLRSIANGIINLVGYLGGVFVTVLGMLPFFKLKADSSLLEVQQKVLAPFLICTVVLIAVLIFLIVVIKENKMAAENKEAVELGELESDTDEVISEDNKLNKKDRTNFIIILVAIFLWFMSFNSFETFGSLYFKNVVQDSTMYSTMATVLSVSSILTFVIFSGLSNKIGRKWTIMIGLASVVVALASIALVSMLGVNFLNAKGVVAFGWKIFFLGMSLIMGIGWALININSFPMIVEYSNSKNLGKFTSYYYIASMLAQSITPILVGLIMDKSIYALRLLFVYASILMAAALVVFLFVKEKFSIKERIAKAKEKGPDKRSALEKIGDMDD